MYQQWEITIPELTGDEPRNAYVYVPDAAVVDDERRYPVLYMFDGQNLFRDADASFGKSWGSAATTTSRMSAAGGSANTPPSTSTTPSGARSGAGAGSPWTTS